jgi:hypothetical protein
VWISGRGCHGRDRVPRRAQPTSSAELVYVCRPARTVHQAVSVGNFRESVANLREPQTCANLREYANPSRIRELVANPRICRESVTNPANPLRTCANPVENFCESVANLRESAQPHAKCASVSLHVTRIYYFKQCRLYVGSCMLETSSVMPETSVRPFLGHKRECTIKESANWCA